MNLTVQLQVVPEHPEEILEMMSHFNSSCNWLSSIAFNERIWYWMSLQKRAYRELRQQYGITANQALVSIRKVAATYKTKDKRGTQSTFKPLSSMPLFKHVYYDDSTVMFYGQRMPYIVKEGTKLPRHPKEGYLSYDNGKFYIYQVIRVDCPEVYKINGYLGCDLGIKNILADSQGQMYSSAELNGLRKRQVKLRCKLERIGTRSAKHLLQLRRNKEGRFARDLNHCISKKIVAKAKRQHLGIALEDLKCIREHTNVHKAHRRQYTSWAFNQLRLFIEYKAQMNGVPVVFVDPHYTSQTCPQCGTIDKQNRKSQMWFECISCGFGGLADIIAAGNIARRAAGNQPYAPLTGCANPVMG
jgi:IS605 OrfB family transposase